MLNKNIFKILTVLALTASFHSAVYAKAPKHEVKSTKKSVVSKKKPKVSQTYIEEAIVQAAEQAGVPADLLRGICTIESNLTVDAFVHSDGGDDENHAFGMCQVLYKTAVKYVGKDKNCQRDFRDLEKNYSTCKLFGPKVNALAAARYLKSQLDRYDGHHFKAAAAYNSGSIRHCSESGWLTNAKGERVVQCKPGDLLNRYYVTRLKSVLSKTLADDSVIQLADADFKMPKNKKKS